MRRRMDNRRMFFLRHTHAIARWALLCFVLSLGVAIAAPLVNHQSLELVCSSVGSVKLLVKSADGSSQVVSQMGDCPLCITGGGLPPPEVQLRVAPAQPLAYALRSIPAARLAWLTAAPLPARGPPTFL